MTGKFWRAGGHVSVSASLAFFILLLSATPAASFSTLGRKWPSGSFSFKADVASFTLLPGAGLSQTQARWWINYSLSQWKERTGVNLSFTYSGDFTGGDDPTNGVDDDGDGSTDEGCITTNGINEVVAGGSCASWDPGCFTLALVLHSWSGTNQTETDMCVFGPTASWAVELPVGGSDMDLIGVMVHEFGHALGLDHTSNTVMDSAALGFGNTLARYPYGDDINGMRSVYAAEGTRSLAPRWKEYNPTTDTWSANTYGTGGTTAMNVATGVGRKNDGFDWVIMGHLGTNQQIYYRRSKVPLTSSSTWDNWTYGSSYLSWRSPAVAGRSGTSLWTMAMTNQQTTLTSPSCSGIRIWESNNGFEGVTRTDFANDCTIHQPALVWDPSSSRFVLMIVNHSNTSSNDKVFARTSTDGITWTTAQDLNEWTTDGVSLACGAGDCLLGLARGTSNSETLVTRAFTVNAGTGAVTIGGTAIYSGTIQRTPAVGALRVSGVDRNLTVMQWSSANTDHANGRGALWSSEAGAYPPAAFSWVTGSISTDHTVALATSPLLDETYMFWVQP